jgi:transcriptional regulator with XRE-family HTH domain
MEQNNHTNDSGTLLGRMVVDRLRQLGVTRSQLSRNTGISRQTIWEIEHNGRVNISPVRLSALDNALHWPPGTAMQYALGQEPNPVADGERIEVYVARILELISHFTVDELEREAIWLEEEMYGRSANSPTESVELIRHAMREFVADVGGNDDPKTKRRRRKSTSAA